MNWELFFTILVIVVALGFDFTNGFHDAANAIATSVGTKALRVRTALIMAAVCNFIGAFLGQEVAKTIQSITTPPSGYSGLALVAAALLGAITWNMITWYFGLPGSSSHALLGALVGAALVAGTTVKWDTIWTKVLIPMVTSPVAGLILAFLLMRLIVVIFRNRNPQKVGSGFRHAQTVSAAAMALGHGLQDAQKTMGIIVLVLISMNFPPADSAIPVGRCCQCRCNQHRHGRRWEAHHAHAWSTRHRPRPGTRLLRGSHRRVGALHNCVRVRRTRIDNPSHHRVDHGLPVSKKRQGRALERRREHHVGVDSDATDVCDERSDLLVDHSVDLWVLAPYPDGCVSDNSELRCRPVVSDEPARPNPLAFNLDSTRQ